MATVTIIPATAQKPMTLRVAAYCRVSSDSADQLHSYAVQIRTYTELIENHENWKLVDIYADEGLTGTRMDKREEFNRMLADCRKGKIDKILVKSISRFARNTRDCLVVLWELKLLNVSVQFEEDHIDTETLTSELMVSVFGSLAQQESLSISQNLRMSYQRRMEKGEFLTANPPLGYTLTDGCRLKVVPQEAAVVQQIFEGYVAGASTRDLARRLTGAGVPTTEGNLAWNASSVMYILSNEKYVGDALCRKNYTTQTLPFTKKTNHGEQPQYYIENSHPPIISRELFAQAQLLREKRAPKGQSVYPDYPLRKKIQCGVCGATFVRKQSKRGVVAWCCGRHDQRAADCEVGRIPEAEIYAAFVRMFNNLRKNMDTILTPALTQLHDLRSALQQENPQVLALNRAIADTMEQQYKLSNLHAAALLSADIYTARCARLDAELKNLRKLRQQQMQNDAVDQLLRQLQDLGDVLRAGPDALNTFDEACFEDMVEIVIAVSAHKVRFRLHGGIELEESL